MKWDSVTQEICIMIMLASIFCADSFTHSDVYDCNSLVPQEFVITSESGYQGNPAIYGDIVVWEDERNGNSDIYGYDLSTQQEFQITSHSSDQGEPAIYGNIVVWQDERNGNWDIYGYNLTTQQEFQITSDESCQCDPAIYGDIVVWEDGRNRVGNQMNCIYGYNLSTQQEFLITCYIRGVYTLALYENIVVWDELGIIDIHGYDLSTQREFWITSDKFAQQSPAIYGDIVVWEDRRNFNADIYGYNLTTQQEFQITLSKLEQNSPAIYENIVVWWSSSIEDIYGYDFSTQREFRITSDSFNQYYPAIYDNIVVWQDYRNGSSDIYGCDLSTCDKDGDGYSVLEDCNDIDERVGKCMAVFTINVRSERKLVYAKVYVNELDRGATRGGTMTLYDLEVGKEYTIRVEAKGYNPEVKTVTIKKGTSQIEFEMEKVYTPLEKILEIEMGTDDIIFLVSTSISCAVIVMYLVIKFQKKTKIPEKVKKEDVIGEK